MTVEAASSHISFHPSWPTSAETLVRRAIDRHGGWSLWSRLQGITINLVSLRGFLPWFKGYGRTFQVARTLRVFPRAGRAEWRHSADAEVSTIYERGDMRVIDPVTGQVLGQSDAHRRTFRGLAKLHRWSALDAHYFFGYAFVSYTAAPFILPSLVYRGPAVGVSGGERLEGVSVQYPESADVHSRAQRYFFDRSGLIRRHDYVADVVGRWAVGAHLWRDHATVNGLPLPTRRTVLRRAGRWALPHLIVLDATFDGLAVELSTGAEL